MKKLKKIMLKELADVKLNERGMSQILGGGVGDPCGCACMYAGSGGSSTAGNGGANESGGLQSVGMCLPPVIVNGGCPGEEPAQPRCWVMGYGCE